MALGEIRHCGPGWEPVRLNFLVLTLFLFLPLLACSQERRFTAPNSSMEPTVLQGEKFAVDTTAYAHQQPARGDVVVFQHGGLLILKRVVAIAGDVIEGKDFRILLNGRLLREDYIQHQHKDGIPEDLDFLRTFPKVTIPANHFFVMGDNRDVSDDSRDPKFGAVPLSDLVGKAIRIVKSDDSKREGIAIR